MNQNVAYDLSRFETRTVKRSPQLEVLEQPEVRRGASAAEIFRVAAVVIALVATLSMILYSNAILTELGDAIVAENRKYNVLVSENQRLSAELEGKMSLRNIEDIAQTELGLAKMESYQVRYVSRSQGDRIVRTAAAPTEPTGFKLLEGVGQALEYLRIAFHKN